MGLVVWLVVLLMAAQIESFWPRAVYLIVGTSIGLMFLSLLTVGNDILGEPANVWDPAILAYNLLIKLLTTSFIVGLGFGIGKLHRRRAARRATPSKGE